MFRSEKASATAFSGPPICCFEASTKEERRLEAVHPLGSMWSFFVFGSLHSFNLCMYVCAFVCVCYLII